MTYLKTYLPCCRSYQGCLTHFPPGIYNEPCTKASFKYDSPTTSGLHSSPRDVGGEMNLAGTSSKAQKPGPQVLVHSNDICEQEPLERENPAARALTSLPVELIYSILDFLPLGDPASLSITNRFLSRCIGAKIWSKLKHPENAQEKILFLQNLTKDLSEQRDNCWLCDVCKIFHNYGRNSIVKTINDKIDHFGYGDDSHTYPFGYKLSSELVKMAILRAEKGYSHGICPDRLSCAEIVNVRRPQVRIDYAYRVRVVHGELIVKLGTRFRGDNCNADDNGWENNISECGHDSWPPSFKNVLLQNILGFLTENLRHIKAEYPIIPFDEEKPFSAEYQEPRRDQVNSLIGIPNASGFRLRGGYILCRSCYSTRETTQHYLDVCGPRCDKLSCSFQNVGTGVWYCDKWRRAISPFKHFEFADENSEGLNRIPFESGCQPFTIRSTG